VHDDDLAGVIGSANMSLTHYPTHKPLRQPLVRDSLHMRNVLLYTDKVLTSQYLSQSLMVTAVRESWQTIQHSRSEDSCLVVAQALIVRITRYSIILEDPLPSRDLYMAQDAIMLMQTCKDAGALAVEGAHAHRLLCALIAATSRR
jgi:hypothetical protein